jgi:hypothetical protein
MNICNISVEFLQSSLYIVILGINQTSPEKAILMNTCLKINNEFQVRIV